MKKEMKMKGLALISLGILISLNLALAQEFTLSSERGNYDVCRGTTAVIPTEVFGSGSFSVYMKSSASAFSTLVPKSFSMSGSAQNVYAYVNPPSSTKPGLYFLEVRIKSGSNEKQAEYKINVKDCRESSISVVPEKLTCAGEETVYTLTLDNLGEYKEVFDISVEGIAKDWTELSINETELTPGEKKFLTATVNPPANVYGPYEITFNAKARDSLASASAKSKLDIKPCYEYSASLAEEDYSVCENVASDIAAEIFNKGTSDNNYKINLKGPKWVSAQESIKIQKGRSGQAVLSLNPPFGSEGVYKIEIETLSENGAVKRKAAAKINVEKCYGVTGKFTKQKETVCKTDKEYAYELNIINSRKLNDTVKLNMKSPGWIMLDDEEVSIGANEEKKVMLRASPYSSLDKKTYDIAVTMTSENGAQSSTGLKLDLAKEQDCYSAAIESDSEVLKVNIESGSTMILEIKNTGIDEALFSLIAKGDAKDFTLINPNRLKLKPGDAKEAYIFSSPPLFTEEKDYDLEIIAKAIGTSSETSRKVIVRVGGENNGDSLKVIGLKAEKESLFRKFVNRITGYFLLPPFTIVERVSESEIDRANDIPQKSEVAKTEEINEEEAGQAQGNTFSPESKEQETSGESIGVLDLDALLESSKNKQEASEHDLNRYKTYLGGALLIFALIVMLSTGLMKKVIDFFDEE